MNNFTKRLLTGSVYVIVTAACVLWRFESALAFFLFVLVACSLELTNILKDETGLRMKILSAISSITVFSFAFINQNSVINAGYFNQIFILVALLFILFVGLSSKQLADLKIIIFSWIYLAIPLALFMRNGQLEIFEIKEEIFPYDGWNILIVFVMIWASDTFAYLTGRAFGKNKLAPTISPKKTIEGLMGSVVLTMILAYFLGQYTIGLGPLASIGLGLVVVSFSTLGDLFESKIKRILNIKDSGTSLPGHGGFLDRFDSVLFAGPASYAYLSLFTLWC